MIPQGRSAVRFIGLLAVLLEVALAADVTATASAATSTYTIGVGVPIGQNSFSPDTILNATKGDVIVFEFHPLNHSVVKMDPNNPCVPYDTVHPGEPSWWSGFMDVPTEMNPAPTYKITVNDTDPIWFYCSAPGSCTQNAMVGIINPPDNNGKNLSAIQAAALKTKNSYSPGQSFSGEASNTESEGSSTTTASSSSSSSSSKKSSLSGGAIAGIVIGAVAAFALIGLLFFFIGRKKKAQEFKTAQSVSGSEGAAAAGMVKPEHPPIYQDPRYTYIPPDSPTPWNAKPEDVAAQQRAESEAAAGANEHRISELASQNYDPVELYTPGMGGNSPDVGPGEGPRIGA